MSAKLEIKLELELPKFWAKLELELQFDLQFCAYKSLYWHTKGTTDAAASDEPFRRH